jgi:hypothetical protein
VQAGLSAAREADMPADPGSLLRAWAAAYATNDGARCAILHTEGARFWGSVSREQAAGRAGVAIDFGRVRPGSGPIL